MSPAPAPSGATGGSHQHPSVESGSTGSLPESPSNNVTYDSYERKFSALFQAAVQRLRLNLPHLKNVLKESRYRASRISIYDYSSDMSCIRSVVNQQLDFTREALALEARRFISSVRHEIGNKCTSRLIVVEDVCLDLVRALSVVFGMSPEVCEEHLLQSGWTGQYADSEVQDWNSRRVAKEHVSIRWHRPCRISLADLEENLIELSPNQVLYHKRTNIASRDENGEPNQFRDVELYPNTNAWRRHLDFGPTAAAFLREHELVACEERVTMWQRYQDDCLFVIMFTDPTWQIREHVVFRKPDPEQQPRTRVGSPQDSSHAAGLQTDLEKSQEQHQDSLSHQDTRIPRDQQDSEHASRPLTSPSSIHHSEQFAEPTSVPLPESRSTSDSVPGSIAQVSLPDRQANNSLAILKDCARQTDSVDGDVLPESEGSGLAIEANQATSAPYPRRGDRLVESDSQSHIDGNNDEFHQVISIAKNVAARGPIFDYVLPLSRDASLMAGFRTYFRPSTSTSEDLHHWLLHQQINKTVGWKESLPGSVIFNILLNDSMDFFQVVETFLDQIETRSSNETAIRENLSIWRSRITRISAELRYLEKSISKLADFLTSRPPAQGKHVGDKIYDIQGHLLPDVLIEISRLEARIRSSLQDLVSSVSIIESRKGIAEAESIAKLTELAFFFIPLSFTATFFGMQVKEINDSNLSIWIFFVLALTVTASSYGLRLLIRSQDVISWVGKRQRDVRKHSEIPRDRPIRTTFYLRWAWHRTRFILLPLLWVLITLLPLIPIWSSTLNRSIKWITTVTILIVSGLILVLYGLIKGSFRSARILERTANKIFWL